MTDERVPAGAGPADRRRSTWARILLRVGLLVALLGLLAGSAWLLGPWSPDRLRGLVAPAGPLAPAVFVGLFVVLNSAGVPAPLLGAAGGLTLSLIPGALATLAGMTVAACVQFLLARRLTGPAMAAARFSGTDRLQEALQRRGWLAVVVLRLVPGPFVALNLAAGLTPLRLRWSHRHPDRRRPQGAGVGRPGPWRHPPCRVAVGDCRCRRRGRGPHRRVVALAQAAVITGACPTRSRGGRAGGPVPGQPS
jgi:uncharacterized membrane protein YdjX (TVP38/TMEM64 family)